MSFKKITLCKLNSEYCPTVEVVEDGRVKIGEAPEFAFLSKDQWNLLVENILSNRLSKLN
ncbi:MAG: hypothetical protein HY077_04445 [Elusimicrobia bacterium]|nr:hypothetical protein [Elusimicrobiota bacterium]